MGSVAVAGRVGILVYLHIAVQRDDDVGNADGLDNLENDGTGDDVAGRVLTVGIIGFDVELGDVAGLGTEGGLDAGKQRPARAWRRRRRRRWGCASRTGRHARVQVLTSCGGAQNEIQHGRRGRPLLCALGGSSEARQGGFGDRLSDGRAVTDGDATCGIATSASASTSASPHSSSTSARGGERARGRMGAGGVLAGSGGRSSRALRALRALRAACVVAGSGTAGRRAGGRVQKTQLAAWAGVQQT